MKHHLLLGILCIASLSGILVAGLWPFRAPANEVSWLKDRNGLHFGEYGTVMSNGALDGTASADPQPCSIEMWLDAATENGGTILSFFAPDNPMQLSLNQSHAYLVLQSVRSSSPGRARAQRIYLNDVFQQGRPVFVTITSSAQGTTVYLDGKRPLLLTIASSGRRTLVHANGTVPGVAGSRVMPCDCTGRLMVGDSPQQPRPWSGQVTGLAIYGSELSAPTVLRHYDTWTKIGKPDISDQDHTAALYLFDERTGNIVHNRARASADLFIPGSYMVLYKPFLHPDWDAFSMHWGNWLNNLKNVVGFVPLGLCFCAYLTLIRRNKRAGLVTIILGGAVSLTVELLQGYLPTRDSGTADLITNTIGTWIGVLAYHAAKARWELRSRIQEADRSPN